MSKRKKNKGSFTERPEGAAPLFDSESGRKAALQKSEAREIRNRTAMVEFAREKSGNEEMTYEESFRFVVLFPQFMESRAGKTAASKLVAQMTGEMLAGADAKVLIDKRQLHITNTISFDSPKDAQAYIEDQRSQGNFKQAAEVEEVLAGDIIEGETIDVEITFDDSD